MWPSIQRTVPEISLVREPEKDDPYTSRPPFNEFSNGYPHHEFPLQSSIASPSFQCNCSKEPPLTAAEFNLLKADVAGIKRNISAMLTEFQDLSNFMKTSLENIKSNRNKENIDLNKFKRDIGDILQEERETTVEFLQGLLKKIKVSERREPIEKKDQAIQVLPDKNEMSTQAELPEPRIPAVETLEDPKELVIQRQPNQEQVRIHRKPLSNGFQRIPEERNCENREFGPPRRILVEEDEELEEPGSYPHRPTPPRINSNGFARLQKLRQNAAPCAGQLQTPVPLNTDMSLATAKLAQYLPPDEIDELRTPRRDVQSNGDVLVMTNMTNMSFTMRYPAKRDAAPPTPYLNFPYKHTPRRNHLYEYDPEPEEEWQNEHLPGQYNRFNKSRPVAEREYFREEPDWPVRRQQQYRDPDWFAHRDREQNLEQQENRARDREAEWEQRNNCVPEREEDWIPRNPGLDQNWGPQIQQRVGAKELGKRAFIYDRILDITAIKNQPKLT